MITLVVAEDSLLVREGIVRLLSAYDDVEIAGVAVDLPQLLAAVDEHAPNVVLTDIRMPPTGTDEGIRAAAELRARHPDVGVVVLSQYVEPGYALSLFDGGSQGRAYLLKERLSEGSQLIDAIRAVAAGGSVVDPKVVETLVNARARTVARRSNTSPRASWRCCPRSPRARTMPPSRARWFSPSAPSRSTSTPCSRSSA